MTITAQKLRLDDPSFVIDYDAVVGAAAVQLRCAGRSIRTVGNQDFEDNETFCSPGSEAPGVTNEAVLVDVIQSIGVAGLWNQLKPLQDQLVKFALLTKRTVATGDDNPEMYGELYVPYIPLVDSGVRKFSTFTLEFKIEGIPLYNTTVTPEYAGHAT